MLHRNAFLGWWVVVGWGDGGWTWITVDGLISYDVLDDNERVNLCLFLCHNSNSSMGNLALAYIFSSAMWHKYFFKESLMLIWSYLLQFQFIFGVIGIGMPTQCWTPQYWLTHVKLWLAKPTMAMLWWRAAGKWNRVINWNTSVFDTLVVIL